MLDNLLLCYTRSNIKQVAKIVGSAVPVIQQTSLLGITAVLVRFK